MEFMQATAICLGGAGVLITGPSGSGKSDLALRLIEQKGAQLIADDGVMIDTSHERPHLFPHPETKGIIEIRGMGLVAYEPAEDIPLWLHVELSKQEPERLPDPETLFKTIAGLSVFSVQINPFHVSSVYKVDVALSLARQPHRLMTTRL